MSTHNLGDLIDRSLDQSRLALVDLRDAAAPRRWTHAAIDRGAGGVAAMLARQGFARGTRIAILSANRAEHVLCYFGIMRAGLVAVPVNTRLAQDVIDFVLQDAAAALVFADAANAPRIPPGIPVIGLDDPGPGGFAALCPPDECAIQAMAPDEIGQMLYTSGSTGRPKGVPLTHAGQLWALSGRPKQPAERHLIAQPLFHMNGLMALKGSFHANACVVLMPGFDARAYTRALAEWQVTSVMAVPTMFARVIKETDLLATLDFSALKRIMLGSAPITLGLMQRIQAAFPQAAMANGYGTTEAGPGVFGPHPDGIPTPPIALGVPIPGVEVRLVGGPGPDEGVLEMRTPATMSGYNNLPGKTAEVLRDGWYHSGDVMRRDAQGFYSFVGRADDMFVCAGENITPGEVEKLLERHPEVQLAAVVPLPDEDRAHIPVAFVVPRAPGAIDAAAVKRWALENGPAYQHPRRVAFVDELPWAGTNKIDRRALIDRAHALEAEGGWAA